MNKYDYEIDHYEVTVWDYVSVIGSYRELNKYSFDTEEEAVNYAKNTHKIFEEQGKDIKTRVQKIFNVIWWL